MRFKFYLQSPFVLDVEYPGPMFGGASLSWCPLVLVLVCLVLTVLVLESLQYRYYFALFLD